MASSSLRVVMLWCLSLLLPRDGSASVANLRGANATLGAKERRLGTYAASTSRFYPGDTAGTIGQSAACGGANLNTVSNRLSGLTDSLGKKYFAIAPSQNMVQPLTCSSANEATGTGSPSKDAGSYASDNILHLYCGQCIEFTSDITKQTVGGIVFDTCPATATNDAWCTKNGAKNSVGYYNHVDFFGTDSESVTTSIGDNPTGSISLVECPSSLVAAMTNLAAAGDSSASPVCNFWYDTSSQVWQGSPGQDAFGCAQCSGPSSEEPSTDAPTAAPTEAPTSAPTAAPCEYTAKKNKAVKNRGTGGNKLKRKKYGSTAEYLTACKAACTSDPRCGGFVDDPTDKRGRMCKPKKVGSSPYKKNKKTFYIKGDGC